MQDSIRARQMEAMTRCHVPRKLPPAPTPSSASTSFGTVGGDGLQNGAHAASTIPWHEDSSGWYKKNGWHYFLRLEGMGQHKLNPFGALVILRVLFFSSE